MDRETTPSQFHKNPSRAVFGRCLGEVIVFASPSSVCLMTREEVAVDERLNAALHCACLWSEVVELLHHFRDQISMSHALSRFHNAHYASVDVRSPILHRLHKN